MKYLLAALAALMLISSPAWAEMQNAYIISDTVALTDGGTAPAVLTEEVEEVVGTEIGEDGKEKPIKVKKTKLKDPTANAYKKVGEYDKKTVYHLAVTPEQADALKASGAYLGQSNADLLYYHPDVAKDVVEVEWDAVETVDGKEVQVKKRGKISEYEALGSPGTPQPVKNSHKWAGTEVDDSKVVGQ